MRRSSEVELSWPARAVLVATCLPVSVASLGLAPISFGFTLPFAVAFFWVCWWCSTQGADPPARPGLFFVLSGFTIPLVVWGAVLLQGALQ